MADTDTGRFIRETRETCIECEDGMYEIRGFQREQVVDGEISFTEQTYKVCPVCKHKIESKQHKGGVNANSKQSNRPKQSFRPDSRGSNREGRRRPIRNF